MNKKLFQKGLIKAYVVDKALNQAHEYKLWNQKKLAIGADLCQAQQELLANHIWKNGEQFPS